MMQSPDKTPLNDILQQAFGRLSCPLEGHSTYATLEAAILQAYDLGVQREAASRQLVDVRAIPFLVGMESA